MGLKAYESPKHYLCLCDEMICGPCMTTIASPQQNSFKPQNCVLPIS
jgi:hypothetical protein